MATVGGVVNSVQATTNTYVVVANTKINTSNAMAIAYTIKNTHGANSITWEVVAGNASDLSDGVVIKSPAAVAAAGVDSYSVSIPPFKYYAVYVKSTSDDTAGEATVRGIAKN